MLESGPSSAQGGPVPYIVAVIELPDAGNVRMVGNLLGDPMQNPPFDVAVEAVFEDHPDAHAPAMEAHGLGIDAQIEQLHSDERFGFVNFARALWQRIEDPSRTR